jgi:antitoxin (DNA-binding transcriptional repressor) of toxin-antitoxin stability system
LRNSCQKQKGALLSIPAEHIQQTGRLNQLRNEGAVLKTINAFDAKTHLSKLLRDVEQYNEEIVIKRHHHSIACLVPFSSYHAEKTSALDIISGFRDIRENQTIGPVSAKKFVAESRKQ